MSKELEALNRLYCEGDLEQHKKDYELLKQALQRLECIEKANPSEALEILNRLAYENACCRCEYYNNDKCYNKDECVWKTIKQVLLKAQEQEKVLEIIANADTKTLLHYLATVIVNEEDWLLCKETIEKYKRC